MSIRLEAPGPQHEERAIAMCTEHAANGEASMHGASRLNTIPLYADWLELIAMSADPARVPNGWVQATSFFAVREADDEIVGIINIRHMLNDFLLDEGGHIGYGIRPSARRRGYATEMLRLALDECRALGLDRVLLVCNADNTGSARTIQKNGGVLEDERVGSDGLLNQRYWIAL